jgi:hypothetical protein
VTTVSPVKSWVDAVRRLDTRWQRYRTPGLRHVVFDARTAMEYAMMAPVHRRLVDDPRVRVSLMSSDRPEQVAAIFRDAPDAAFLSPRRAVLSKVDVCVAADFVWATLARGTCRIQMFHGVAGKWAHIYDRPATSMRLWDRLFFINHRRLRNYIAAGAIEAESQAIRLIGMPKLDCLVDGSHDRDRVLARHGLDPARPTVLYAPTWTPYSSLNVMGEKVVQLLLDAGFTVLVKLHENSRDLRRANSGGIDWHARLEPMLRQHGGLLIEDSDACPWMVAADILISDHSSVAFEYLLLDRPVIRIHLPELIARGAVAPEYVELMIEASTTAADADGVRAAVDHALGNPGEGSARRRAVAADLFHQPGTATDRAMREIYAAIELEPVCVPDRHTVVSRGSVAATEVR